MNHGQYRDPNTKCISCGSSNRLTFNILPDHRRMYENEAGEQMTEYFGPARDYFCDDCGKEWTVYDGE